MLMSVKVILRQPCRVQTGYHWPKMNAEALSEGLGTVTVAVIELL
jgi:hypothetical protein